MTNPKVDAFLQDANQWQLEFTALREIVLSCHLEEELKWGVPCYTNENENILLIHGFKSYCALLFTKGSLLKDDANILIQQTPNVQAARQMRFTNIKDIESAEAVIKAYIFEAIEIEKAGLEVPFKSNDEFDVPEELQQKFEEIQELKPAFDALTPGRQRAYILHFSAPKLSKTRIAKVEACVQKILAGKGLYDN